ncbi:IbrB-like domain-containing protein [Kitasatospora sp. NPDC088783]|uniref:IbrB-like domain-containing protein n=1 Tax=Kitasatospora sp. NPDC088783 TaxID=3364077 RepID=UPI0037F7C398
MSAEQTGLDQVLADQTAESILQQAADLFARLQELPDEQRIDTINALKLLLRPHSPMRDQPVDCVLWVPAEQVRGNDYNPNSVAPPEMELLKLSIESDGFTQPIVTWRQDPDQERYEVVDGFHRHLIGRSEGLAAALHGRLPVTVIRPDRSDRSDRQASTIRHNRARGEHSVEPMSEMVKDLHLRGKSDEWIGRELGMDPDEVLRLRQVSSLAAFYSAEEFSAGWEPDAFTGTDRTDPLPPRSPSRPENSETIGRLTAYLVELPDEPPAYTIALDGQFLPGAYADRAAVLVAYGVFLGGEKHFPLDDLKVHSADTREAGRPTTVADVENHARSKGLSVPGLADLPGDFADEDARLVAYGILLGGGTPDLADLPAPITLAAIETAA